MRLKSKVNMQVLMLEHPIEPCSARSHLRRVLSRLCSSECKPAVLLPLKASSMCDMHLNLLGACPAEAQLTYVVVHAMQQHRMQASAAASQE